MELACLFNEITLENGKRLDSYTPGVAIVSRKATELIDIDITTLSLIFLK